MCHEPDSQNLERLYLNAVPHTDVSALGLGEEVTSQDDMVLESSELALTEFPPAKVAEIHGSVLNAALRLQRSTNQEWHLAMTRRQKKKKTTKRSRRRKEASVRELGAEYCMFSFNKLIRLK